MRYVLPKLRLISKILLYSYCTVLSPCWRGLEAFLHFSGRHVWELYDAAFAKRPWWKYRFRLVRVQITTSAGNCERRRNMESKWNVRAVIGVLEVQKILVCTVRSYFAFSERERGSLKLREDFMRLYQKRHHWHNDAKTKQPTSYPLSSLTSWQLPWSSWSSSSPTSSPSAAP